MIKLGSLFDGAGGFPLAGVIAGITPVWASEIEPFPIRVTTKRFPGMKHLGSITEINGGEIEPVDVITFGSPCQDLSVANGNRKGLDGERSGLFREAVRIIREMREATNGLYPTFIVWENVTGAFSSNGGEDFRQVVEEIAGIAEKGVHIRRPSDGWEKSGEYVGDGWSIAYRTYDAQFWGIPQRRRRIYLVADFGGQRAGRIQFERERLLGDFAASGDEREEIAGVAGNGVDTTGSISYITPWDAQSKRVFDENGVFPTLDGADGGGSRNPGGLVMTAGFNGHKSITGNICYKEERSPCIETKMPPNVVEPTVYGLCSKGSNAWQSDNPNSGCYEAETARTIDGKGGDPTCNQGGMIICVATSQGNSEIMIDKCPTITSAAGTSGNNKPYIAIENHPGDSRAKLSGNVFQTLSSKMGTGGNNTPMVLSYDCRNHAANGEVNPTLQSKKGGGYSLNYINPVFTIGNGQANQIGLHEKAGALTCVHDQQAMIENRKTGYRVRRLTPLECCRLQGFPDFWTREMETVFEPLTYFDENMEELLKPNADEIKAAQEREIDWWAEVFETHRKTVNPDKKPKTRNQIRKWLKNPRSDSAEYKMWGNSLAIPCAYTILAGIAEEMEGNAV